MHGVHDGPSGFQIEVPVLARGTADRDEALRSLDHINAGWPTARVLTVGPGGRIPVRTTGDGVEPSFAPALDLAAAPPVGAVLLGTVAGVDHWAVAGAAPGGAVFREVGPLLSDLDAGLVTTAIAVLNWHAASRFCPRCGQPTLPTAAGMSRLCPAGHHEFPRTDPAIIVLVYDGADHILLARQPSWRTGRYSVLAGFTEAGEPLEGTVTREVREEVGILVRDVRYLGSQPWPFPRSLMIGFAARADEAAPLAPRHGEIEAAQWFHRDRIRDLLAAGGALDGVSLPDQVSIARRMIEGWFRAG